MGDTNIMILKKGLLLLGLGVLTFVVLVVGYSITTNAPSLSLESRSPKRITVTGNAESKEDNEIATFSVTVSTNNVKKEIALNDNNTKMNKISTALKTFGIPETDIETQNVSINQSEDWNAPLDENGKRPMFWYASNSIVITLKEVGRANELLTMLQGTEATSTNGPNYSIDDIKDQEAALLKEALQNARSKATVITEGSGMKVGEALAISEGSSNNYYDDYKYSSSMLYAPTAGDGGGGSPTYQGTTRITKTVTVTFELVK